MSKKSEVKVMVGTRKGGFIFTSNARRKRWSVSDVMFKGWNTMHMTMDPRDGRMYASVSSFVFGPNIHYSDDLGETWTPARAAPKLERPSASGRPAGTVQEAFSGQPIPTTPEQVI